MKVLDRKVCYSFDDDPIAIPMVKISLGMNYRTGTEIIRWVTERELDRWENNKTRTDECNCTVK